MAAPLANLAEDHALMIKLARELEADLPAVRTWLSKFGFLSKTIAAHSAAEEMLLDPVLRTNMTSLPLTTLTDTVMYAAGAPAQLVKMDRAAECFSTTIVEPFGAWVAAGARHNELEQSLFPALYV